MADGSTTDSSEFLEDTSPIDGVDFPAASGIAWLELAAGIVGGTITAIVLGIQSFLGGLYDSLAGVVDGVGDFAGSLITVVGNDATEAIEVAFAFDVGSFGVFAAVVGIASILAAYGVFEGGLEVLT